MDNEKKKQILDVAAMLFSENGYSRTTTRDISRASGISKAALYYFFKSKEDVLFEILDKTISFGLHEAKEISQTSVDTTEKISRITQSLIIHYSSEKERMKLLAEHQKALTVTNRKILDQKRREYVSILVKLFDDLKVMGKMDQLLDSKVCAYSFFAVVIGSHRWYDPKGTISPQELADIFVRIFTTGIQVNGKADANNIKIRARRSA